ncbi:BrnA antitoxin family protein [Magnetospirillum moscoviense]|nr:BrnA antitoxin family protein [Magnetospirillum moscoviense]
MTAKKHVLGSDLAKVDAHVIQPEEYDEIPEWTDEMFERADLYHGDTLIRRGRPPKEAPKKPVSIRLDPDLLEYFRASGPGWQTRVNDLLRQAAGLPKAG